MFEFDAGKLIIIGIVALIVIGPKELPRVLRQLGQAVGKMRRMAAEFQGQFMEAMREADLAEIETLAKTAKADVDKLAQTAKFDVGFNPVADVRKEIEGALQSKPTPEPTPLELSAPMEKDCAAPQLAGPQEAQPEEVRPEEAQPQWAEFEKRPAADVSAGGAPAMDQRAPAAERETIDAEMQALATALKAEIETPSPREGFRLEPEPESEQRAAGGRLDRAAGTPAESKGWLSRPARAPAAAGSERQDRDDKTATTKSE